MWRSVCGCVCVLAECGGRGGRRQLRCTCCELRRISRCGHTDEAQVPATTVAPPARPRSHEADITLAALGAIGPENPRAGVVVCTEWRRRRRAWVSEVRRGCSNGIMRASACCGGESRVRGRCGLCSRGLGDGAIRASVGAIGKYDTSSVPLHVSSLEGLNLTPRNTHTHTESTISHTHTHRSQKATHPQHLARFRDECQRAEVKCELRLLRLHVLQQERDGIGMARLRRGAN